MVSPAGCSTSTSERTRSQTSWMLTSPTSCGWRCGASSRSTSACSRSASWMMTSVYSRSSGASRSICSSWADRKSTRLNSSHTVISYAVFCLKKKKNTEEYEMAVTQKTLGAIEDEYAREDDHMGMI